MPNFKSPNQRKFLFAADKDKMSGQNPQQVQSQKSSSMGMGVPAQKSAPIGLPTSHPPQMSGAPHAFALGAMGAPQFHPPVSGMIHPTAAPDLHLPKPGSSNPTSIPALPGMPRFGRMRKYLK